MHRHSPLMQSLLSQSQTPAAPRRAVGFFGSGCSTGCPAELSTRPTSGLAKVYFSQPFRPSTGSNPKQVPHCLSMPVVGAISQFKRACRANGKPLRPFLVIEGEGRVFLFFHSVVHSAVEMDSTASENPQNTLTRNISRACCCQRARRDARSGRLRGRWFSGESGAVRYWGGDRRM